jgi:hypothetical protein
MLSTIEGSIVSVMLVLLSGTAALSQAPVPSNDAFTTTIRVLLEDSHDQSRVPGAKYNFGQTYFHEMLVKTGAKVETTTGVQGKVRRALSLDLLKGYDLVISHGKYNTGPTIRHPFLDEEIEAIGDYVVRGGFLMVISGVLGREDEPQFYNPLLKQFGVAISNDLAPGKVAALSDMEDPLIHGVPFIYPIWGGTLNLSNPNARVLASFDKKPVLAYVPYGEGFVIVVGGGTAWMNQGFTPRDDDSEVQKTVRENKVRLMMNLLRWVDICRRHPAVSK